MCHPTTTALWHPWCRVYLAGCNALNKVYRILAIGIQFGDDLRLRQQTMPKPAISKTADDEAKPKPQFTTAALLAKAEDFMDRLEYSMALRFYRR